MQVSSSNNSYINNKINIKFNDKETSKNISIDLSVDAKNKLEQTVPDIKHYLQTMYEEYKKTGTIDENNDGFLDVKEFINSKRFVQFNIKNNQLSYESLKDIYKNDDVAIEVAKDFFKELNVKDLKVSINEDFNKFLSMDTNLDANISNKEAFSDLEKSYQSEINLAFALDELLKKQLEALIEEEKRKVMNGITQGAFSSSLELKEQSKTLNTLLQNDGNLDSLSEEQKSIFSTKDNKINIQDIIQKKEKLTVSKNYIDTQTDNAKIFSLKV